MGVVYEGVNLRIHRRVAIKVLHPRVAEDEVVVRRFEREAQAAGRIGSQHIVEVLDLGELPNGDRFMVMEYLEGESLHDRMRRPMTPVEVVPIAIDLLDGLADAHRAGIIHRDLKPANVFLVPQKRGQPPLVKVLDFGVSKFRPFGKDMEASSTGTIVGTPYYMAPEQARAEKTIDHRADLFSVGVILYRAIAGRVPFQADSFSELLFKVVLEDAPQLSEFVPTVDPELAAIIHRAITRAPADRFQNADELAAALATWLERQPPARSSVPGLRAGAGQEQGPMSPALAVPVPAVGDSPSGIVPRESSPLAAVPGAATAPGGSSVASLEISLPMTGLTRKGKVTLMLGLGALGLAAAVALVGYSVLRSAPAAGPASAEAAPTGAASSETPAATAAPSSVDSGQPAASASATASAESPSAGTAEGSAHVADGSPHGTAASKSKPGGAGSSGPATSAPNGSSTSAVGRKFRTKLD